MMTVKLPAKLRLEGEPNMRTNTPYISVLAALGFFAGAVVIVISGHGDDANGALLIGFVSSSLPSLIAAGFSERTARDVRNGTVKDKVVEGTTEALEKVGVVTRAGPVVAAQLAALTQLLEHNTKATVENTAVHEEAEGHGKDT